MKIKGNLIDVIKREIYFGEITISNEKIKSIRKLPGKSKDYILPGFIDAHVHIESSMLIPSEFAKLAVVHGTVATVSDPHEIANVMGIEGVEYMIANGQQVPFKFFFGAPSCVPATDFESAGAKIGTEGIKTLLKNPDIKYLAEMMNYPGVLFENTEVLAKIAVAKALGKPIDGHAPGLRGAEAKKYIDAGISTDHECFSYEEGLEKLKYGMKILIREGSAAKNFNVLISLLAQFPDRIMFCSDDKHPDDLVAGHINQLVARALQGKGLELFDVLQAACLNPVQHYDLEVGLLRPGDAADFIITDDLESFKIKATYINGKMVAENGKSKISSVDSQIINNFHTEFKEPNDFRIIAKTNKINVIKAIDGEIFTESITTEAKLEGGLVISDMERDVLKMAVVNRYSNQKPALAFIQNFTLQNGAIASCVGHDSHNIIAVGTDDESICRAINLIIEHKGGISAVNNTKELILPLPIAGIMTNENGYKVAELYGQISKMVKTSMGCSLTAPFMTLSFMALLVIPQLKLSDKGLFDGKKFQFIPLFVV